MTLLEAHQALSRSLGDSFTLLPNATAIPNGVRYSTAQRNNYLYRAMLYILDEVFVAVQHLERQDANKALYKLIPSMIAHTSYNFTFGSRIRESLLSKQPATDPLVSAIYIVNANATSNYGANVTWENLIPVHILDDAQKVANHRLNLRPDPYITRGFSSNRFVIVDENAELRNSGFVNVYYIPYPTNPTNLLMTDRLGFEERYMTKIIQLASMYAWQDSEDLENASMLAQTIKPIAPVQEVRNANSN